MLPALLLLAAPVLRLDFAVGAAHPVSSSECCMSNLGWYPRAPLVYGGAAIEVTPHLSLGLTSSAVLGGEGFDRGLYGAGPPGFEAWNVLLAGRAHTLPSATDGGLDFFIEGGVGVGHLISMQIDYDVEHAWLRGHSGPALEIVLGGNYRLSTHLSAGLQASWMLWTNVEQHAYELGGGMFQAAQSGLVVSALSVSATIAFASAL